MQRAINKMLCCTEVNCNTPIKSGGRAERIAPTKGKMFNKAKISDQISAPSTPNDRKSIHATTKMIPVLNRVPRINPRILRLRSFTIVSEVFLTKVVERLVRDRIKLEMNDRICVFSDS